MGHGPGTRAHGALTGQNGGTLGPRSIDGAGSRTTSPGTTEGPEQLTQLRPHARGRPLGGSSRILAPKVGAEDPGVSTDPTPHSWGWVRWGQGGPPLGGRALPSTHPHPALPLLCLLHGCRVSGERSAQLADFLLTNGFILVRS